LAPLSRPPHHSIVQNIVDPAAEIAHGFEKTVVVANSKYRVEGILTGYSRHSGVLKVKTIAGQSVNVAFRKSGAKIEYLKKHSWMPSAAKMGLSNRDVRDIAEYLKKL
jgi:putative heme-binding domain-containing protein